MMGMACGACLAEEPKLCKSFCSSEERQCRPDAEQLTEDDTNPIFAMSDKNANARNFDAPSAGSEKIQPGRTEAFKNRRMERVRLCDGAFSTCDKACVTASRSSVVLTPEAKR
ncbi:MAG: hypothetical protein H7335_01930 [Massilia sp.]|nr:hypothetical protein [Massilia sp.]